jgi:ribonuclease inhibitor
MPIKKFHLDGNEIHSMAAFYDEIASKLPLSDHFGRNLDALADILSTDIEGPFEIIWEHADVSKKTLKADYAKIVAMMKHVAAERADFKIVFKN